MIDPERAASILHGKLVESVAKAQRRIVMHEALLKRFKHVVPQETLLQSRTSLKNGRAQMTDFIKRDEEMIAEYIDTIRELEALFEDKEKSDIEDLVAYIKERRAQEQKKGRAK